MNVAKLAINIGLTTLLSAASFAQATAADRIFMLNIKNSTAEAVTFNIDASWHNCYEGSPAIGDVFGPVEAGGVFTMQIARVQGHGCDGEQGKFQLVPSTGGGEAQRFEFSNDGGLALASQPSNYQGWLGNKSPTDQSYTWTMLAK